MGPGRRAAGARNKEEQQTVVHSDRWVDVTKSEFPWEREALAFIRERLPYHEPYRAWANF
jgi:hypothetical protein